MPMDRELEVEVPLRLTVAQHRALQATARGEVYRTHTSIAYTLTGPCGSTSLWALSRADLIADPPEAREHGRHRMVITAKGRDALASAPVGRGAAREIAVRSADKDDKAATE
jgi:hypothetical protein